MDKKEKKHLIHTLSMRDTHQNKRYKLNDSEEMKNIFYANENERKAGVAILRSNKIDFKTKPVIRDKKRTIHNDIEINQMI